MCNIVLKGIVCAILMVTTCNTIIPIHVMDSTCVKTLISNYFKLFVSHTIV